MGSNKVIQGLNDLETYCKQNGKEDLLKKWHPTKNGNLKLTEGSIKKGLYVMKVKPNTNAQMGVEYQFNNADRVIKTLKPKHRVLMGKYIICFKMFRLVL